MKFDKAPKKICGKELSAFILVFILVILGVIIARVNPDYYHNVYAVEDGFIEWLTALGLLAGCFVCLYRFFILAPFRPKLFRASLIILSLIFLFGFLEEISYGQRIFGFETPQALKEHNTQGEFNIHNLKIGSVRINKLIFGLGLTIFVLFYFLVLPILYRKVKKVETWIDKLAIPVPKWFHVGVYILLFILVEMIPYPKKGEILEFGGVWIFLIMTIRPYNREIFSRRSLSY